MIGVKLPKEWYYGNLVVPLFCWIVYFMANSHNINYNSDSTIFRLNGLFHWFLCFKNLKFYGHTKSSGVTFIRVNPVTHDVITFLWKNIYQSIFSNSNWVQIHLFQASVRYHKIHSSISGINNYIDVRLNFYLPLFELRLFSLISKKS
jgi:hypothetical protein